MARRSVVRPVVVGAVLTWALLLALIPRGTDGAVLPPAQSGAATADVRVLEIRLVAAHLRGLGLSPAEATARLAALSDAERHTLAARLDEIGVGGSAAAALGVGFVVAVLVILILELMGRRVVSRP